MQKNALHCPLCEGLMDYKKIPKDTKTSSLYQEDNTHIWSCRECPGILVEWHNFTDTVRLDGYLKGGMDYHDRITIATAFDITLEDVKKIEAAYPDLSLAKITQMIEDEDVQIFLTKEDCFYSHYSQFNQEELVRAMATNKQLFAPNYFELPSGKVFYIHG